MKVPKMIVIPEKKMVENQYKNDMTDEKREIDPRPQFCISEDVLPAIKTWSTGQKYKMEIEVEQVGSRISDYGDDKGKLVADFKISGIMPDTDSDESKEEMKKGGTIKKYPEAMIIKKK